MRNRKRRLVRAVTISPTLHDAVFVRLYETYMLDMDRLPRYEVEIDHTDLLTGKREPVFTARDNFHISSSGGADMALREAISMLSVCENGEPGWFVNCSLKEGS
jgi:hypothetical protein